MGKKWSQNRNWKIQKGKSFKLIIKEFFKQTLNDEDKITFCSHLYYLLKAGIPLLEALVDLKNDKNGLLITGAKDFQIINGGQTTASLSHAKNKDRADLENIYVQMKLTIVKEDDPEFVHNISKYANYSIDYQNTY